MYLAHLQLKSRSTTVIICHVMTCNNYHVMLTVGCLHLVVWAKHVKTFCLLQAKKVQRKNFSHSEARLREIKRENKMLVDRLAHVGTSQTHTPLPPAPVGDPSAPSPLRLARALMTELACQTSAFLPSTVHCCD